MTGATREPAAAKASIGELPWQVGNVGLALASVPLPLAPDPTEQTHPDLDAALQSSSAGRSSRGRCSAVTCGRVRGPRPRCRHRWRSWRPRRSPTSTASCSTARRTFRPTRSGLPDPAEPGGQRRWVAVPRLATFYQLPAEEQGRHRKRWIDALAVPTTGLSRPQLEALATPVLRLLVARHAEATVPVRLVDRPERQFRGARTGQVTMPLLKRPVTEPDCYLPVVAEAEGGLEGINAYDLRAGISLGPIQINVQRGALMRVLWALWWRDPALFDAELGAPLGWSMQADGDHVDLVVSAGDGPPIILHGRETEQRQLIGYLLWGFPAVTASRTSIRRSGPRSPRASVT
jgi:hypothetical protein